jgi:putative tryptophan/tyrosine transport system substrate-binding protein
MIDRRTFLASTGAGLLAAPLVVEAQSTGRMWRIGYLSGGSAETDQTLLAAFQHGLTALGYVEGKSTAIEQRYAAGNSDRLPELAADLVQRKVDVILVTATAVYEARAALAETPTVFVIADDPVKEGLVASLARPAGHMTGLTSLNIDLDGKRLEILKAAFPAVRRVGILSTPQDRAQHDRVAVADRAARSLGLRLQIFQVPSMDQLPRAIDAATHSHVGALMVLSSPVFRGYQAQTARLVTKTRLPVVSAWREFPEAGGLLSYGTSVVAMFNRAALFVDKILKGAKPGDLPIEQPTKFELVINLKTAKALGLTIPPALLARADEVIQ